MLHIQATGFPEPLPFSWELPFSVLTSTSFFFELFSGLFQPLASPSGDPAHTSLKAQKSVLVILLQC